MLHIVGLAALGLFSAHAGLPAPTITTAQEPPAQDAAPGTAGATAQVGPPPTIADTSAMDPALVELLDERVAAVIAAPESLEARTNLGLAYEGNTIWSLAEQCYDQAVTLAPDNNQWVFRRGVTRFYNGDIDGALADLEQAAGAFKNTPVVQARFADVLRILGEFERSEAAWRQAIAAEASQPQVIEYAASRVGLAQVLLDLDQAEEAEALCRRALELQPGYPHASYTLGLALRDLGKLEEAQFALAEGKGSFPMFPPDPHGRQLADAARGFSRRMMVIENLVQAGNLGEAMQRVTAILADRPDDHMVLNIAARIALRSGDLDGARAQIDKSLAAAPDEPATLIEACLIDLEETNTISNSLAMAMQAQSQGQIVDPNEFEETRLRGEAIAARAIERATRAAQVAPTVGRHHFWLGVAQRNSISFMQDQQQQQQALQAALGSLQNAGRLGCTEPSFDQQLATIHMQTGNQRASLRHAERNLARSPKDPNAIWLVVQALVNNERTPDIAPYVARLEDVGAGNGDVLRLVVTGYMTLGEFEAAERVLGKFETAMAGTPAAAQFVTAARAALAQGRAEKEGGDAPAPQDGPAPKEGPDPKGGGGQ